MGMGWSRPGRSPRVRIKLPKKLSAVALVGGSLPVTGVVWAALITKVADEFVKREVSVLWCGMGTGLAGAIAKAVLKGGGKATAVVVKGDKPPGLPAKATVMQVTDLHSRTGKLLEHSQGCLVVPGGVGTLMELTTFAAFRNAGLYTHPVVVLNADGWADGVLNTLDEMAGEGAIDVQATVLQRTTTASAAFAALVDPKAEKVNARKPLVIGTRAKLRSELVQRARNQPRVFRILTVSEKLAALKPLPRPPGMPAFVIVVGGGPRATVRDLALTDADASVRAAAAAPTRLVREEDED